jgi:hypothetical protein
MTDKQFTAFLKGLFEIAKQNGDTATAKHIKKLLKKR